MQEDGYYPINIKIEPALANQSNKEKKCRNSKLKSLIKTYLIYFKKTLLTLKIVQMTY